MKYRILQLDGSRPRFRELAFRPLDTGQRVDFGEYASVYQGEIHPATPPAVVLENLFRIFNLDHPADFRARSLSVSDIVLLEDTDAYYCQMVGWELVAPDRIDGLKRFRIVVEQLVPDDKLADEADRRHKPAGRYLYAAGDAGQALYRFSREVPIANADDFGVRIEEYQDR